MPARIYALYRYPLKGARGHRMGSLQLDPVVGVVGDRVYAISRKGPYGEWKPKAAFHVGMNSPAIAAQTPRYVEHTAGTSGICRLEPDFVESLGRLLGIEGPVNVQDTYGGYTLADTRGAFVSFLNLSTVKALSDFIGRPVDYRRYRANALIEGLAPFEELTWVNTYPGTRKIQVGAHEMLVDDATERCQAIEANVNTGEHDETLRAALQSLMSNRGYTSPHRGKTCVMGVYGKVLDNGVIRPGDEIRLI